jgi:protein-disulfide isomerase
MMKKTALLILMVLIASLAFADEKRFSVPLDDSPALGPPNAPVTIVEFLDFQ